MSCDRETSVSNLREQVLHFRDARDWRQFHHPKELALALSIEVGEILELFRFKSPEQIDRERERLKPDLSQELADVLHFVLLLSHELDIDLSESLTSKLRVLEERYPVALSRGRNLKYTELSETCPGPAS